jgi:phage-related protein
MPVGFDIGPKLLSDNISFTRINSSIGTIDGNLDDLSIFEAGTVVEVRQSFDLLNDGFYDITSSSTNQLEVVRQDNIAIVPEAAGSSVVLRRSEIVCPDRSLKSTIRPKTIETKFGDGYSLKVKEGVFTLNEVYDITFNNRPLEEIEKIIDYLENLKGVDPFDFTVRTNPDHTIRVRCDDYSLVYTNATASGLSAKFTRAKK